jgi:hypothetical protein
MAIEFKNPPLGKTTTRSVSSETQAIIEALRGRPGEWALIKQDVSISATTWWKKRPGLEARSSTIGKAKNKCDVYARWVGEDAA